MALLLAGVPAQARKKKSKKKSTPRTEQTQSDIKRQKEQTSKEIKETDRRLKEKNGQLTSALNDLNVLDGEIADCNRRIEELNAQIDGFEKESERVAASMDSLTEKLTILQQSMGEMLRRGRRSRAVMSDAALVFSANSFLQAHRRMNAIKQFNELRHRRVDEINLLKGELQAGQQRLDSLSRETAVAAAEIESQRTLLSDNRARSTQIVNDLRREQSDLQKALNDMRKREKQLDAELQRLIQEEIRRQEEARRKEEERRKKEAEKKKKNNGSKGNKGDDKGSGKSNSQEQETSPDAATRQLNADFASNKGRLPYPVEGKFTIIRHFGSNRHPDLPRVTVECAGIDILTAQGATVRSVFDGEVSAIFCPDGYNNVVVVRHGNYMTVYANLGSLSVRAGEKVQRNQPLGRVFVDPADNNRSILHFEIRNATSSSNVRKENPEVWLKR